MKDYQEALDRLENFAYHGGEKGNNVKIIQELVNEKIEQESRKEKLIVGSRWECVAKNRGRNTIHKKGIEVYILKIEENFSIISYEIIYGWVEDVIPTDQFLLCFKPIKEGE